MELLGENLKKENERLRKKNKGLQIRNIATSKQACKWYQQRKAFKTKYKKIKVLYTAQVNMDATEVVEGH